MTKRILPILIVFALVLFLCTCSMFSGKSDELGVQNVESNASTHEQFLREVNNRLVWATEQEDVSLTFQNEYLYGIAQAEISSLRLCIDTVLYLKGEGDNLSQVIGAAPYKDWDAIVGVGLGSAAPFYFEGLLFTIQGKNEEAEECYKKAKANPTYTELDFYYLRNMSVDELYKLKKDVSALENKVYQLCTPRTKLLAKRTGAEFSPYYHLAMAKGCSDRPMDALQCALNALIANPLEPTLYSSAVAYAIDAGDNKSALEFLNQGLYVFPQDGSINYMAALFSAAMDDKESAKLYIETAKANTEGALLTQINALEDKIGE